MLQAQSIFCQSEHDLRLHAFNPRIVNLSGKILLGKGNAPVRVRCLRHDPLRLCNMPRQDKEREVQ